MSPGAAWMTAPYTNGTFLLLDLLPSRRVHWEGPGQGGDTIQAHGGRGLTRCATSGSCSPVDLFYFGGVDIPSCQIQGAKAGGSVQHEPWSEQRYIQLHIHLLQATHGFLPLVHPLQIKVSWSLEVLLL